MAEPFRNPRTSAPRLLDLFCKGGGAARGYHRAGFEVVGVDIEPQPHYPFDFVRADALTFPLEGFDAVHASPPCQAFSVMRSVYAKHHGGAIKTKEHPDLLTPTREILRRSGLPYVIENVPQAPGPWDLMLCGSMFGLRSHRGYLRRHRYFEVNWSVSELLPPCQHVGLAIGVYGHGSAGLLGQRLRTANRAEARVLMGTPDMTRDDMSQAIPPAYTEWIGRQLMAHLEVAA